ncbi:4-(cytidine 5'-diphospho)-2-C-methyl-D-erythritol kinase [Curvivirga aplysinae]|uniref:4-(cytidine 5'-diphospho)-2-C-methyl-D-erythritol kinase n=1 Tax=Curvivirga aplysinae TaxID=2529852 RepID=UPI0012BD174E|nr:4-(cytidine 5'-diphospho)-2-C-methyl-D-erythritol kinase [Curvivirga aplysinae]MTI10341.1 4-(cytidine 5'-diphospho)-2-C-methyl-D-erythritol kinase [Curvivirga aplysinae]
MVKSIEEFAAAKVNLDLLVTGKREDGYHLLDSLVVFTEFGDHIRVSEAEELSLDVSGPYKAAVPLDGSNLVLKAAKALQTKLNIKTGAKIHLEKNIPAAAGVGGGSADAAATLKALMRLWDIKMPVEELSELGLTLGADIPVCLLSQSAIMRGVGEDIRKIAPLPPLYMLLVNPGVSLSTPDVFKARAAELSDIADRSALMDKTLSRQDFLNLCLAQKNDLTEAAANLAPVVTEVLNVIEKQSDCLMVRMSGSGATCFGLFADIEAADMAKNAVLRYNTDWWAEAAPIKM